MNALRTAIIGVGNMGTAHAICISGGEIKGLTLSALCDSSAERCDFLREKFPETPIFTDFGDILNDETIDAVIIATPHPSHAKIAEAALNAGKHVLVEKPVDISVSSAQRLNKTAEKSGKVFAIMFNQRTNGIYRRAREIVRSGELGELKRTVWIVTNWYRTQSYYDSGKWRATWAGEGGGVLLNQAPHNLDLWQWICGMPCAVTAFCDVGKYHNIEVEDDVTIRTRYKNGATGVFITSTGEYPGTNRLEISGDRGKCIIENGILKLWRLKRSERELCFTSNQRTFDCEIEYSEYTPQFPETAHKGILSNFANAVLNGEPLIANGTEGINELTISNAAYLSSWCGSKEIELPLDTDLFDKMLGERIAASKYKDGENNPNDTFGGYKERWSVKW